MCPGGGRGGQKLLGPPPAGFSCPVAGTACFLALPGSSGLGRCLSKQPFISAASFPKGKGMVIDYLFGAGGGSDWEAGGCWWLLVAAGREGLGTGVAATGVVRCPSRATHGRKGLRRLRVDSDLF